MSVGAAITTGPRNNTDSLTLLNPLFWRKRKAVQTSHDFNPVEFDGIKITVIESFPDTKKLYGVTVTKPIPYHIVCMIWILIFGDIRKADIVIVSSANDTDRCSLNIDYGFS